MNGIERIRQEKFRIEILFYSKHEVFFHLPKVTFLKGQPTLGLGII